ncbi:MAG: hypothetical protein R3C40_11720 [Parvularculaceae bacterium]
MLLGGTVYYVLAGGGLAYAGWRVWQGDIVGVYVFLGVFAFTLLWNFYEAGLRFWASVPRLAAPMVICFVLLFSTRLFPPASAPEKIDRKLLYAGGFAMLGVFVIYFAAMFFPHEIVRNPVAVTPGKETARRPANGALTAAPARVCAMRRSTRSRRKMCASWKWCGRRDTDRFPTRTRAMPTRTRRSMPAASFITALIPMSSRRSTARPAK